MMASVSPTMQSSIQIVAAYKKTCGRCGHSWISKLENPKLCPSCCQPWNKVKRWTWNRLDGMHATATRQEQADKAAPRLGFHKSLVADERAREQVIQELTAIEPEHRRLYACLNHYFIGTQERPLYVKDKASLAVR